MHLENKGGGGLENEIHTRDFGVLGIKKLYRVEYTASNHMLIC